MEGAPSKEFNKFNDSLNEYKKAESRLIDLIFGSGSEELQNAFLDFQNIRNKLNQAFYENIKKLNQNEKSE